MTSHSRISAGRTGTTRKPVDPFQNTLQNIEGGRLAADLDEKLRQLVGVVKERGKTGTISLTVKIKPLDHDAESVSVVASVKVTEPAKAERASIFFTTEDNRLVRDNPAQKEMDLQPVPKPASELPKPVAKVA